jgi:hypothetical protein
MIKPTIGRIVWFHPTSRPEQPLAAIIVYVNSDISVNLTAFGSDGIPAPVRGVLLVQQDEDVPTTGSYCEWMPYQKGQAAKTEALEAKLASP